MIILGLMDMTLFTKKSIDISDLSKIEPRWFDYVNNALNPNLFKTDVLSLIGQNDKRININ